MNQVLSLSNLSCTEIQKLLELARELELNPVNSTLHGKVIGLIFMNPSLRTLASFQAGVAQLGGISFVIQPGAGSWQLEFADGTVMDGAAQEHIREAIPVLGGYADVLAVRRFADQTSLTDDLHDAHMRQMAELSSKPFINMESASDHPCQALADWKTLDDLNIPSDGGKFVLSWAYHPKPLPFAVPAAALRMAAQRGMEVTVLRPEGFDLPESIVREAERLSSKRIVQTSDRSEAMKGSHVLYCKSWTSPSAYGDADADAKLKAGLHHWCVDEPWFETALPDAKFMHCLPVRRNVKVTDRVLDGHRSVVLKQAQNRLHVQKAVLTAMSGGCHV